MEFYAAERKKELLPFVTVWMDLKIIMLSEINQRVKDKYHMISLYQPNQQNKQAQYNQRHLNKEQADSNKRGRGEE